MERSTSALLLSSMLIGLPLLSGMTMAATTINLSHQPTSILATLGKNIGPGVTVTELSRSNDFNQTLHVRIQQMYLGVPVFGSDSVIHVKNANQSGSLTHFAAKKLSADTTMNGHFYNGLESDLGQKPDNNALQGAIKKGVETYSKALSSVHNIRSVQPHIHDEAAKLIVYIDNQQKAHWAYQVSFNVDPTAENNLPAKPVYIIDATSLAIYTSWDNIQTNKSTVVLGGGFGGNLKMGKMVYDGLAGNLQALDVTRDDKTTTCSLKNAFVTVSHDRTGKIINYDCALVDADHNGVYWNGDSDKVNGGYSPSNDALFGGLIIKNMYQEWYGVPVLVDADGQALMLKMVVHAKMDNAYWDGTQMTFGDGIKYFYPLTSLGVAAHEVSHGFTQQNSNLNYSGQSGGMNEAFSDMAAQAAEYFAFGKNNWQIGPEIFKAEDEALRYMDTPSKDCKGGKPGNWCSIDDASQYKGGLDVHYSSGVYNRLFYLISTSKGYTVKKAFDLMVKANQNYWTSTSTWDQGACGILSAAEDYGYDTDAIKLALETVKVKYNQC